jgi:LicD family protein
MFSIGDYLKDSKLHNQINLIKLSDKDLKFLQDSILDVYKDILLVCEKYGFHVMMVAGSAIGAIRHKGFIPWDDDMDMLISRRDYYEFLKCFSKEFGDKYYITSPFSITKYNDYCIHIIRKDITLVSLFDFSQLFPNGVAVDICTYENVPENCFLRFFHGFISDILLFTTNSKRIFMCRNKYSDSFFTLNWKSKIMYYIRIIIGALLSFISYSAFCSCLDKWISLYKDKKSTYVTIPTGYLHYFGEKVPSDVFDPVSCSTFEGLKAFIPNRVDVYLENRYGKDYMIIPPKEKQESHPVVSFSRNQ